MTFMYKFVEIHTLTKCIKNSCLRLFKKFIPEAVKLKAESGTIS